MRALYIRLMCPDEKQISHVYYRASDIKIAPADALSELQIGSGLFGFAKIEVSCKLIRFDQCFEAFLTELVQLLYKEQKIVEKEDLSLEQWHDKYVGQFTELGCDVFTTNNLNWEDDLQGMDGLKQQLDRQLLTPLLREALFKKIAASVSRHPFSILPAGVLLCGPPGVGKTYTMKLLGSAANLPVVVLPCQALMSCFYGQSERTLAKIFQLLKQSGKVILLIDEIDTLAPKREGAHESTARLVSIFLAELDGLSDQGELLLVATTNNEQGMDPALLDRFSLKIDYPLPSPQQLAKVIHYYAKQLSIEEAQQLSVALSGWNFRKVAQFCEQVLRKFVSELDLSQLEAEAPPLPSLQDYLSLLHVN